MGATGDNGPLEEKHFTETQGPGYKMLWLCTGHRTAGGSNLYSQVDGDLPALKGHLGDFDVGHIKVGYCNCIWGLHATVCVCTSVRDCRVCPAMEMSLESGFVAEPHVCGP